MSEHKTHHSNWTDEQKKLYWERRKKGLPGTAKYVNVHRTVLDENGKEQLVPLGFKRP